MAACSIGRCSSRPKIKTKAMEMDASVLSKVSKWPVCIHSTIIFGSRAG